MDADRFWQIIEDARDRGRRRRAAGRTRLSSSERTSARRDHLFDELYDQYRFRAYCWDLWGAAYIMNGGCSDDGFEYFRNWVISRGREVYYKAKENPDSLISEVHPDIEYYDFESFWYVALQAFEETTGKELYDYIDEENFNTCEGKYPQFEFTWQEEDTESMKKICPQLFAKM